MNERTIIQPSEIYMVLQNVMTYLSQIDLVTEAAVKSGNISHLLYHGNVSAEQYDTFVLALCR